MMPAFPTTDFSTAFRERRDCVAQLLAFASEQIALIDSGEYSRLLTLLGRKQHSIGRLEEIQRLHPRLALDWVAGKVALSAAQRADCEQLLAETETMLALLMEHERHGTEQIARQKEDTHAQLQSLGQASRANATYGATSASSPRRRLNVEQ